MELNKIYNEDCLETLARMEDNSVDLIITSPPYNKGYYNTGKGHNNLWGAMKGRQIGYDKFDDCLPPTIYEEWQKKVISECMRVLKSHGSMFYNHKDIHVDGVMIHPKWVYDFPVHQKIIWNRGSSFALDPHYFQPITEYIFWIVKSPKEVYFNKKECAFRQSVWNINFEINTKHPAPFPELLVGNIVLGCSKEGDIIYDPFMGSGTTAKVACKFKRNYIGSEISSEYVKLANERVKNSQLQLTLF